MESNPLSKSIPVEIQLQKILVPVDFSAPSQTALCFARRFAHSFGGDLTLLYVVETAVVAPYPEMPPYLDHSGEDMDAAEKKLQTLATEIASDAHAVHAVVRSGLAAHEIVEAARELNSDLIIIATHGYTGWKHFCIGSTAERVVRTAPCPVFVAREKEHDLV